MDDVVNTRDAAGESLHRYSPECPRPKQARREHCALEKTAVVVNDGVVGRVRWICSHVDVP